MELECLIDFDGTAAWRRRKALEYPEDQRNQAAAEILERLAAELPGLEGTEVHMLLEEAIDLLPEDEAYAFSEMVSEELRAVGFSTFPVSAITFVMSLAHELSA